MFALGTERIQVRLKPAFVKVRNLFDLVQIFTGFAHVCWEKRVFIVLLPSRCLKEKLYKFGNGQHDEERTSTDFGNIEQEHCFE